MPLKSRSDTYFTVIRRIEVTLYKIMYNLFQSLHTTAQHDFFDYCAL